MPGFEVSEAPRSSFIEAYNNKNTSMLSEEEDYASEKYAEESLEDSETNIDDLGDILNDKSDDDMMKLTRHESANVRTWRLIVLVVIIMTGAIVTALTYTFLKQGEEDDYRVSYDLFTQNIRDASDGQSNELKLAVSGMAETVTSAGINSDRPFPFVRVPLFEIPASQTRELSGLEMFSWNPIVEYHQREEWETFCTGEQDWLDESKSIVAKSGLLTQTRFETGPIRDFIWRGDPAEAVPDPGPFAPVWQMSPPPFSPNFINYNMLEEPYIDGMLPIVKSTRDGLMSAVIPNLGRLAGIAVTPEDHEKFHAQYVTGVNGISSYDHPHSVHIQPVFADLDEQSEFVGFLAAVVPWDRYLANLLPEGVNGIYAVVKNTCGQNYTYVLNGNRANYLGEGDKHDQAHDNTEVIVSLTKYKSNTTKDVHGHCVYSFYLYSSDTFKRSSESSLPVICTICVSVIFIVMALTFCIYDEFVRRRNTKVVNAAARSNAIVSSLFPTNVRDRLFAEKEDEQANAKNKAQGPQNLKTMLHSGEFMKADPDDELVDDIMYKSKPIADLFPETTILFADIAGFTAWSSVREPSQVFVLLETLYRAFDEIAKKRRVFKVETVGDCYVAVTGLPDPRKDHAVAMCRFARDCMFRTRSLCRKLEKTLGPDTGDLAMRMGMHSGPVTAGVLRGERSRFQLFGDTMNTAARMEHTGIRDRIQMSQETADLVIAAGKTNWLSAREDIVVAKGKGEMQTYWLELSNRGGDSSSVVESSSAGSVEDAHERFGGVHSQAAGKLDSKTIRLIDWNVDVLLRLLKSIVARREACPIPPSEATVPNEARFQTESTSNTLDEVKEIIKLPKFNAQAAALKQEDPESIMLDPAVIEQLHDYVCNIASIYRENSFHNFEHASHVTMSVVKLLSRIVAPSDVLEDRDGKDLASSLHDHTYGITSDPLTQFACVFSALIHDVDHAGVPNAQLVKEGTEVAMYYKNKSVAEQNSVDLAWGLLMDNDYIDLRRTIYQTDAELKRFRQLVVNSVMATDIVDKQLKALRNQRWDRAFSETTQDLDSRDSVNRKATIVIEHLIQASDVAHTMQHWHIYRKWNERFFVECYQAFKDGRAERNPAENWYEGEIGFFDFYIIPLAKKLKDCGVFGVSSDEYLNYAIRNRQEWEARGREVVDEMVELVSGKARPEVKPPMLTNLPNKDETSARPA